MGTCGPDANGCSDLGDGTVVLPPPYDQVTNTCSNDADCNGVSVDLNVGAMLRDLTGLDSIDDALVEYPMGECAAVTVANTSCGVCVPCKVDSDCQSINVDAVAADAFGPIGSIAAALLMDQVFGNSAHVIHMYCESVAGDYGVCSPCPGFLNDCSSGGGGGGSGSSCQHDECDAGGKLDAGCSACATDVCAADPYCCNTQWDAVCVSQVPAECGITCN
jgi:hypothetical protein